MNRLIIPTSDATYGDIYFSKDEVISILRSTNNTISVKTPAGTEDLALTLAVSEVGSSASYDAFIKACYDAKPGGDTTVVLPEGQSITTVVAEE
jgi:pantothenate kinase-related protein Tda10